VQVFDPHGLEVAASERLDLRTGERPGRAVRFLVLFAGRGEHKQRTAGGDEFRHASGGFRVERGRECLHRDALEHEVERLPPVCRRVEQVGDYVVHRRVREPLPRHADGGGRDVERRRVEPEPRDVFGVHAETGAHHERAPPRAVEPMLFGPAHEAWVGLVPVPRNLSIAALGGHIELFEPARRVRQSVLAITSRWISFVPS